MMEPFLVPNNLYCDGPSCSMISAAQHLAERTLPEAVHDFVTVTKMVPVNDKIVTPIVVIAIVVRRSVRVSRLLRATSPDVIHRWVIEDFLPLVLGQMLSLTALEYSFTHHERAAKQDERRQKLTGRTLSRRRW